MPARYFTSASFSSGVICRMKMPDSELRVSPSTTSARASTRREELVDEASRERHSTRNAPARANVGEDVTVARDATVASVAIVAEERRACAKGQRGASLNSRPEARPRKTPVVARKRACPLTVVYGRGSVPLDKSRENLRSASQQGERCGKHAQINLSEKIAESPDQISVSSIG